MHRTFISINLLLVFAIMFANGQDISVDEINGPICVLKDTVTGNTFPLSPVFSRYNVIVTDGIAHIDIRQLYINEYENISSIVYVFPLPHDGSVHKMEMEYNDSLYKAEIYEKKKAQQIYDSIKKEGGVAAILIQHKPNIFQQAIANIAWKDSAVVRICISMPLDYNDGVYELSIPTMISARYGDGVGTNGGWNPPENRDAQGLQINVLVQTGYPISNLNSPTHPFSISQVDPIRDELEKRSLLDNESVLSQPHNQTVLLAQSTTYPNRDYVLRFSRVEAKQDFSLASFYDVDRKKGFFSLNIFPDTALFDGDRPDLEIILLVDISGSQGGWPLVKEKEIANAIFDKLKPTDRFTVMSFENNHDWLWEDGEIRTASASNISAARDFVNGLNSLGGTELLSAINEILSVPVQTDHERFFVFLTDGFITNEEDIFERIKQETATPTIFTFGAGNNLNRYFLDNAAKISNGLSYEITCEENILTSVNNAWSKIESPQLKNIAIDWGSISTNDIITPFGLNLYRGRPVTIYGTYENSGSSDIKISGYMNGNLIEYSKKLNFVKAKNTNIMIPQVWAKQKIEMLALEDGASGTANMAEIINLSIDFQVLSKYTAFLAINSSAVENKYVVIDSNSGNFAINSMTANLETIVNNMSVITNNSIILLNFATEISVTSIEIFDIRGRIIHAVALNSTKIKTFRWDGICSNGYVMCNSFYVIRIRTNLGIINRQFYWNK